MNVRGGRGGGARACGDQNVNYVMSGDGGSSPFGGAGAGSGVNGVDNTGSGGSGGSMDFLYAYGHGKS